MEYEAKIKINEDGQIEIIADNEKNNLNVCWALQKKQDKEYRRGFNDAIKKMVKELGVIIETNLK